MRLEKEQGKMDKTLLRRLEKELSDLKSLSTSVLGPLAARSNGPATTVGSIYGDRAEDALARASWSKAGHAGSS